MKNLFFYVITFTLACNFSLALSYQEPGTSGPAISVSLYSVPTNIEKNILKQIAPSGVAPNQSLIDSIRLKQLPFIPNDPSVTSVSSNQSREAPIYSYGWYGPDGAGWVPSDAGVAQGIGQIIITVNSSFYIYNEYNRTLLYQNTFENFFTAAGSIPFMFDPKVVYDPWSNRWSMLVLGKNASNTVSYYYLAVSQTSDALGLWWLYRLDAALNGSTPSDAWADFPGLGFSYPNGGSGNVGCLAITSNQYSPDSSFYPKIRLLRTSQLYSGAGLNYYDFWDFRDAGNETCFSPKPARQLFTTANTAIYVFDTKNGGGSVVNIRRIDDPTAATPTMNAPAAVSVIAYTPPPPAPCLGGSGTLDLGDCRTQDVYYMNGFLYSAWSGGYNWGSGNNSIIQYVRINVATNAAVTQSRFGYNGGYFVYPSVAPEFLTPFSGVRAGIGFSISSSTTNPNFSVIGLDGDILSAFASVEGTGYMGNGVNRFGDYSGIAVDIRQNGRFWSSGQLARAGNWGTGLMAFAFSPFSGISNSNLEIPDKYVLSQNFPNPFNPLTKISISIPNSEKVKVIIYDIVGKEVSVLLDEYIQAGNYVLDFDASRLTSGVYIYQLLTDKFTDSKKMTVIK